MKQYSIKDVNTFYLVTKTNNCLLNEDSNGLTAEGTFRESVEAAK